MGQRYRHEDNSTPTQDDLFQSLTMVRGVGHSPSMLGGDDMRMVSNDMIASGTAGDLANMIPNPCGGPKINLVS